jgi:hypothetical protein
LLTGHLGTKLYQLTRKAITRRQPALVRALKKFNGYCARLELLRPPGCNVPIPAALPTTLDGLRSDPLLHQDVWIQASNEPVPRWLEDYDVRDGIRSLHVIDRCTEEADRLNLERANLGLWLTEELAVVARVIAMNGAFPSVLLLTIPSPFTDPDLHLPLVQRQQDLEYLERLWAPALRPRTRPQNITAPSALTTISTAPSASTAASLRRAAPSRLLAHPPSAPAAPRPVSAARSPRERQTGNTDEDDEVLFEGPRAFDDTDIVASEELDPGLISDADEPLLVGEMLEMRQEVEETSGVKAIAWELRWETLVRSPLRTNSVVLRTNGFPGTHCRLPIPARVGCA